MFKVKHVFSDFLRTVATACAVLLLAPSLFGATRWGLMVGIDHYSPAYGASTLPSCVNDARGFRDTALLEDGLARWPAANIQTLTDSQATKTAIRTAFQALATQATAGDVVVYFHSSHGGQYSGTSTYLCTYNADYPDTELGADLARFDSAVSVIVVVDTCHSGGLFKGQAWPFAENAMAAFRATKAKQLAAAGLAAPKDLGTNIGFMTACDYDEYSYAGSPYSLFAGSLIRACGVEAADTDDDGQLQFMEAHNYAAVRTAASQTAQHYNAALLSSLAMRTAAGWDSGEDAYEQNDTLATAYDLSGYEQRWLSTIEGLGTQTDDDWYAIEITRGFLRAQVNCTFTNAEGNIDIALVDTNGQVLATSDGTGNTESIDFVVPAAGRYYVRVHAAVPDADAGNAYDLMWDDVPAGVPAPDLVVESISHTPAFPAPGNTVTFTVRLRNYGSSPVSGLFTTGFWSDRATAPGVATPPEASRDCVTGIAVGAAAVLQFQIVAPAAGTYTAWAYPDRFNGVGEIAECDETNNAGPTPAGYAWTVTAAVADDAYEPNDTLRTAYDFSSLPGTWLSTIAGAGVQADIDWYAIRVPEGALNIAAECRFEHDLGNIDIGLINASGTLLASAEGTNDVETLAFTVSAAGTYYLAVYSPYAGNAYDLRWNAAATPAPPPPPPPGLSLAPVYRFYSSRYRGHFFTISEAEKNNLVANLSSDWRYEGISYYAFTGAAAGTVPLYRFWSDRYHGHFFTTSEAEKNNIVANLSRDWRYEGVAYYVYPDASAGRTSVYRFWSTRYKHHFFTTSEAEKNNIVANLSTDWTYEGVAFYVPVVLAAGPAKASPVQTLDEDGEAPAAVAAAPDASQPISGDVVFPLAFADGQATARVYDVDSDEAAEALAVEGASIVVSGVESERCYGLEVAVDDAEGASPQVIHASTFERRADAPDGLGDAAAARADAGTGVGNPVERIVAPASDGPLTLKLWSATRGVVETRTGVAGGETVEFAIPEWNCWHWVGGWCESDNALVLSLWLRHGFVE